MKEGGGERGETVFILTGMFPAFCEDRPGRTRKRGLNLFSCFCVTWDGVKKAKLEPAEKAQILPLY